ncbi:MAG: hypothetical protein AAFN74_03470 [Myxococcota bacterium]
MNSTVRRLELGVRAISSHGVDMQTAYEVNLWLHILTGALSLICVLIPLWARKGGTLHCRVGWIFTGSMVVVSVTGFFIAVAWIAIPLEVKPLAPGATPEELARQALSYRATGPFFGLLSFMTAYSVWGGISALKDLSNRGTIVAAFCTPILITGLVVLTVGLYFGQVVFMIFGTAASAMAIRDLWRLRNANPRTGRERIIAHLNAMLGGTTAAATAFTVQVVSRLTDVGFIKVAMWVGPALLCMGTAAVFSRRLRSGRSQGV